MSWKRGSVAVSGRCAERGVFSTEGLVAGAAGSTRTRPAVGGFEGACGVGVPVECRRLVVIWLANW